MESLLAKAGAGRLATEILPVSMAKLGLGAHNSNSTSFLDSWALSLDEDTEDAAHLKRAAHEIKHSDVPVAFPTETVYGLGADATRSAAVRGIFTAKQRPSDNPLIVHIHSLDQLRALLQGLKSNTSISNNNQPHSENTLGCDIPPSSQPNEARANDHIPSIYGPLIQKFWPGPLTLIMPNPPNSVLAPEVTAGLKTFGVRMPSNALALALIKLADVPVAAPSANASSKPSPTAAEHVKHDLDGRISTVIDGGRCDVGVESTVVDGLSNPPRILRPGGVSLEDLRACPGWANVTIAYKDVSETQSQPSAPGMKYRHYTPRAKVILYEFTKTQPDAQPILSRVGENRSIGVIRTRTWDQACGLGTASTDKRSQGKLRADAIDRPSSPDSLGEPSQIATRDSATAQLFHMHAEEDAEGIRIWDIGLGSRSVDIAQGLFSALRLLDKQHVDAIFVEGIDDSAGDVAAAVMNRLRKAAEVQEGG